MGQLFEKSRNTITEHIQHIFKEGEMALLQGCTSVSGSGSNLKGWGFASDTTAILFYELWESYKSFGNYSDVYPH